MEGDQTNKNDPSLGGRVKDFLSELIKTILPRHTVVIILMAIMGYFLFYPTVQNTKLYEALINSNTNTPFLYIYFIFGFVYLVGGMVLTWSVNNQQEKREISEIQEETKRLEIEKSVIKNYRGYFFEENMMSYLVEKLGIPKDKIKQDIKIDGIRNKRFDSVIYDEKNNILAIANSNIFSDYNEQKINGTIKEYINSIEIIGKSGILSFKGGYLFINSEKGSEMCFYNSKGEKTDAIPNYEELCKMKI